jgi:hypothetical protein
MRDSRLVVAVLALCLAAASEARAQQFDAEVATTQAIDGQTVAYVQGFTLLPLRIEDKEILIRADRALVWIAGTDGSLQDPFSGARRIYAEGNVVFMRRDVQAWKVEVFRCDQFYLDFESRNGYFNNLRLEQRPGEEDRSAVTLRAREAVLSAGKIDAAAIIARGAALGLPGFVPSVPGRFKAFDVALSTCTFGDPHYSVNLAEAQVDWRFPAGGTHPLVGFFEGRPEDPVIGGDWITVNIWGLPIFAWPSFSVRLAALTALPLERLQGGHTDRFGWTVESTWGFKLSKGFVDSLNPFDSSDDSDDKRPWGRLRIEADYREERGWAGGIDPSWEWDNYKGYIDSYYLRDDGPDPDNDFDARFLPLERTDRGRIRLFHRHELTDVLRGEVEFSWLSDRNVLEEFFEKEFKEGKEQETVAYLRYLDGNQGGFLLQKNRINAFQTQLELLPKAKGFLSNEPIFANLPFGWTFSQELEVAHLRQRFDDDLGLPSPDTWRLDSLSTWGLVVPLGIANLFPFADARVTAWEETLDGDPADRFIATAGVKLSTDIYGTHDVFSDFLGLHRLRHVIHLEARGLAAFANTLSPSELFPYDPIDGYDDFQELSFEMRHKFQTKVVDGESFRMSDWMEFGLEIEYYPRAERDTVGFNTSNFSYPFNWIPLGPDDATKILDERDWSNFHWDFSFRPSKYVEARGLGEYNPVAHQEEMREYSVTVRPREGLELSVGQVFVFDVTNAFTFGARWKMTEKWDVAAETQYDYKTEDFINRRGAVGRDFHDFKFEAVFEEDVGRDERRFYVTFVPTFMRIPN